MDCFIDGQERMRIGRVWLVLCPSMLMLVAPVFLSHDGFRQQGFLLRSLPHRTHHGAQSPLVLRPGGRHLVARNAQPLAFE